MHVAIVRLTSLGDVIHGLPLAAAIRRHLPAARITWLVEEREQILLRDNPVVDEVVVVPLRRWRRNLGRPGLWRQTAAEGRALRQALRRIPIDVAIDPQGWAHKSAPLVLLTRAPVRIGFARSHARDSLSPLATNRHVTPPPDARHVVDQNLCLLRPLGIAEPGPPEFPLPTFAAADARVTLWLQERGIGPTHRLAVLLPSTRGEAKLWPAERFQEVGRRLLADDRVRLLVLGGPGEEPLLEAVRRGLPDDRVHAWAPGPIPELVAVIRRSHLAIGNDTGPLHVAAVSGVPSVGLFGPTRGARNGPYGAHCRCLQSPTGRMADIDVDAVWAEVTGVFHREGDGFRFVDNSGH
jgi:lipopolysaccharide heptosyltransferase I